jgi:hypothetical protein
MKEVKMQIKKEMRKQLRKRKPYHFWPLKAEKTSPIESVANAINERVNGDANGYAPHGSHGSGLLPRVAFARSRQKSPLKELSERLK